MRRPVSRLSVIRVIVLRDLREFCRDRLWMILTPVSLAFTIVIFWLLPTTVDESITLGIYPPEFANNLQLLGTQDNSLRGLKVRQVSFIFQMRTAIRIPPSSPAQIAAVWILNSSPLTPRPLWTVEIILMVHSVSGNHV